MRSSPLILNSLDDAGRRLARIETRANAPTTEAWLQELLYTHPELLPVDEFDDLYLPAISIGREVRTARGPIDNLYVSPEGGITIVETKLWKNPDKHRTVVAQVIDYAKELATWDYDQLCTAVLASSRNRSEGVASLDEKMAAALSSAGVERHEFQENVATCLSEGRFLLLIVGDRISPNIALLTKAIRSAPGLGFTLGLAEMQLYKMNAGNDWPLIVVPEIVGRTVEKTRGVVQVRYTQEKPDIRVEVDDTIGPDPIGKLDWERFSQEIPKDLVQPFKKGIEEWEGIGGISRFADKVMFFETDLGGERRKIVRCRSYRVSVIRRKHVEQWGSDAALHDQYLDMLDLAPQVAEQVRSDKTWINYDKLSADDLQCVLHAARDLVQQIRAREQPM